MVPRHACSLLTTLCLIAAFGTACSDAGPRTARTPASTVVETPRPGTKPPVEAADLVQTYRDDLAALGLVLTDRGGLIDRSNGGYEKSPRGDHLALYLEPSGDVSDADYVDGIVSATRVFVPDVFERWSGLASMDVCQEPLGELQQLRDPPPVTQIEVTRAQAGDIDWGSVTVGALVEGAEAGRLRLVVSDELRSSEAYRSAT